jgi:hypothetical protein
MTSDLRNHFRTAWKDSASLTATSLLMVGAFLVFVPGIFLDGRTITGVPAWLKPAKFAISSAIYVATLAWLYRYIHVWTRFVRAMGATVAGILILEVGIIAVQAARGTTSHFNVSTPIDMILFSVMGTSILVLWLASVGILVALFRQRFADAAWGWSLRLGLLISLVGSGAGGLMLRPSAQQVEQVRAGRVSAIGAHTVGGVDGGPGLSGVGWSTEHGDLRIPHFAGIHALQVVPFLGWLLTRRRRNRQVEAVFAVSASYGVLVGILGWQALRGQPLLRPDTATFLALGVWLFATALTCVFFRDARVGTRAFVTAR